MPNSLITVITMVGAEITSIWKMFPYQFDMMVSINRTWYGSKTIIWEESVEFAEKHYEKLRDMYERIGKKSQFMYWDEMDIPEKPFIGEEIVVENTPTKSLLNDFVPVSFTGSNRSEPEQAPNSYG